METAYMAKTREALVGVLKRLPGNSAFRQRERMLFAMNAFGSVTTLEAMRFLDIVDPRPRIFELRSEGHWIVTGSVAQASECGLYHRIGEYILVRQFPVGQTEVRFQRAGSQSWVQLSLPFGS